MIDVMTETIKQKLIRTITVTAVMYFANILLNISFSTKPDSNARRFLYFEFFGKSYGMRAPFSKKRYICSYYTFFWVDKSIIFLIFIDYIFILC